MPGGGDGPIPLLLGAVLRSSQFAEEHLGEPMNLSSPSAFAQLPLPPVSPSRPTGGADAGRHRTSGWRSGRSPASFSPTRRTPHHHHYEMVQHLRLPLTQSSIPANRSQPLEEATRLLDVLVCEVSGNSGANAVGCSPGLLNAKKAER